MRREFDGGLNKPTHYCVTVTAYASNDGIIGKATWSFRSRYCSIELELRDGQLAYKNFKVTVQRAPLHGLFMHRQGLADDEVGYLEKLFRETATDVPAAA